MADNKDTSILSSKPILASRFEVLSILGEGGAGTVYRVKDLDKGGIVCALKVLSASDAFDENTLERFKEELKVCQSIRHPNLIEAYDLIELDQTLAFTMEFVEGADLGRVVKDRRPSYEQIDDICLQLLSALAELHQRGIIHRDIKLENILVRNDGRIKLSDLGLIKRQDTKGLTRSGILLGTAQYMPPEYVKATKYDQRGDIYAVGILLYELLTGTRRLIEKPGMQAIEHLLKTNFAVPELPLEGGPPKYLNIIRRATKVNPTQRYQTANEMAEAFSGKLPLKDSTKSVEVKSGLKLFGSNSNRPVIGSPLGKKIIMIFGLFLLLASLVWLGWTKL